MPKRIPRRVGRWARENTMTIVYLAFLASVTIFGVIEIRNTSNQEARHFRQEIAQVRQEAGERRAAIRTTLLADCSHLNRVGTTLRSLLLASFNVTPDQAKKLTPVQRSRFISIQAALARPNRALNARQLRELLEILAAVGFSTSQEQHAVRVELQTIRDLSPVKCTEQKASQKLKPPRHAKTDQ